MKKKTKIILTMFIILLILVIFLILSSKNEYNSKINKTIENNSSDKIIKVEIDKEETVEVNSQESNSTKENNTQKKESSTSITKSSNNSTNNSNKTEQKKDNQSQIQTENSNSSTSSNPNTTSSTDTSQKIDTTTYVVDTNDIFYSIHKGTIDYNSSDSCFNNGINMSLKYSAIISYYNCIDVMGINIATQNRKILGYYLEYIFTDTNYNSLDECNNNGNSLKKDLPTKVTSFRCNQNGNEYILKIN